MEYRQLGQSGLSLSAITFGAWAIGGWMWGGADTDDAVSAIHASVTAGITSIDTAPVYGQGQSEEIVGKALKNFPRDQVQILTKYGMRWDDKKGDFAFFSKMNDGKAIDVYRYAAKDSIIKECEESLRRLQTDYIDLYQIHWPDVTTPILETMEAVSTLLKQGKIRAAGVCNYSVAQMEEAEKTVKLASNQVPYSMERRDIEKDIVPYCLKNHKGILAYSPLQRGLLTGKFSPGHQFHEGDTRPETIYFKPDNIIKVNAFLEKIKPVAKQKNCSLSQLVIRWTIDQPGITIALVGARNAKQAIENAKAVDVKLSREELDLINQHLAALQLA